MENFSKNTKIEMKSINDNQFIVICANKYGDIEYVNQIFLNLFKFPKDKVIGKKLEDFKHPSFISEVYEDINKGLENEKQWDGYLRNISSSQEEIWLDIYIISSQTKEGEVVGYTAIAKVPSDSDIEQAEEALSKKYNI